MDMAGITALLERRCGAWNVRAVFILAWAASSRTAGAGRISPKVMAMMIRNAVTPPLICSSAEPERAL
jgi:hypothetical protein